MKKQNLVLAIVFATLLSNCNNTRMNNINSPLATVIKLNSAESLMDFEEAKKYQDVNSIYSKYSKGDTAKPEDIWIESVISAYSMTNEKKFTNQTKYFNYDITETIDNNNAEVIFKSKNAGANVQAMLYKLELRGATWIVNNIEYKRKTE